MAKYVSEEGFCLYSGFWWKLALPEVILAVHLSVFAGTCAWAASRPTSGWTTVAFGIPLGFLVWTIFEYAFHRWLLHHKRYPLLRKIFWNGFHREHHMYPEMNDPDHHGTHLAISLPIALLLVSSVGLASESGIGLAVSAGWVLAYCVYEALHWLFHTGDPERGLGRFPPLHRLWAAHAVHHLHHANKDYGFTTMFWDKCLGTYLPPEQPGARGGESIQGSDLAREGRIRD